MQQALSRTTSSLYNQIAETNSDLRINSAKVESAQKYEQEVNHNSKYETISEDINTSDKEHNLNAGQPSLAQVAMVKAYTQHKTSTSAEHIQLNVEI